MLKHKIILEHLHSLGVVTITSESGSSMSFGALTINMSLANHAYIGKLFVTKDAVKFGEFPHCKYHGESRNISDPSFLDFLTEAINIRISRREVLNVQHSPRK